RAMMARMGRTGSTGPMVEMVSTALTGLMALEGHKESAALLDLLGQAGHKVLWDQQERRALKGRKVPKDCLVYLDSTEHRVPLEHKALKALLAHRAFKGRKVFLAQPELTELRDRLDYRMFRLLR